MFLLSSSSLAGYGIHRIFSIAKKAKFDGLDLVLEKMNFDLWDGEYISSLSKESGVKVVSITAPSKGLDLESINRIEKLAKELNVQLITFSPPYFKDSNIEGFTETIKKIKKDLGISVAIKNIEPEFLLFVIPKYRKASLVDIKKFTGDTALDIGSINNSSGLDILKAQKILGNSIKNIYLSDKHLNKSGLLPGTGGGGISYLPLESFLMKLKTSGYRGFISLRVNPDELGVGNEDLVLENISNIMAYYSKHYKDYK